MFRTQGGDFGFPYPLSESAVQTARNYSRELFINNKWDGAKRPLKWLLDKFAPLPGWHDDKVDVDIKDSEIPMDNKKGLYSTPTTNSHLK